MSFIRTLLARFPSAQAILDHLSEPVTQRSLLCPGN